MYGWRYFRVVGLPFAVGLPVAGVLLVLASTALEAYGPAFLAGNWFGRLLLGVITFAGYGAVVFSQLRYLRLLVFFGAFFLLSFGLFQLQSGYEEWVLQQRDDVTGCTVLEVTRHQRTTHSEHGGSSTRIWHEYELACDQPSVTQMTTGSRVADEGEQLLVRYDTAGRLGARPAGPVPDPGSQARLGAALFGGGIILRLLFELGVPPFGYRDSWPGRTQHWTSEPPQWWLAGWLLGRSAGRWLVKLDTPVRFWGSRAVVAWLCWRLRRCWRRHQQRQRRTSRRPSWALPRRPLLAVTRVMGWSPDSWSAGRARNTLAAISADPYGFREVLSCFLDKPTRKPSAAGLTRPEVEFLFAPLPDPAQCPHSPAVRLVGFLSADRLPLPAPAGTSPAEIARWLVDQVLATADQDAQRAGAELLQVTDQPHLLDALERAFTDRAGTVSSWETLWHGEEPALLTRILLANPHLPQPLAGTRPGNYVYNYGVLLIVLKRRLDLLPEYVRIRGRSGTISALREGASRPGPPEFTDACRQALRQL